MNQVSRDATDKNWRILIVDDNPDIVTVIRRILTMQGYETEVAVDGQEALDKAQEFRPDLILLDWMLPILDGLEVCRRLKADSATRGIMILLVTGRGSVDNRVQGLSAGADDYIPKPFNHHELLARIRSALRIKTLTNSLEERNRQLVLSQAKLVRKEKMATIGLLASGIAHEFNNIMAGISGYAQLARTNNKFLKTLVEVALTQTERAMELTRSLSSYNRHQDEKCECNVQSVIKSALLLVKKQIEDKGIVISIDIADDLRRAAVRAGQIQEVVLNLVINAIHAIGSDGKISIVAKSLPGDQIAISIADTGSGIPPDKISKIFDPFFTTKGALGGGSEEGTGLGLSVCDNIIRGSGGEIQVESEPGEGTTFMITLPVATATSSTQESSVATAPSNTESGPQTDGERAPTPEITKLRLLIVDDEESIRGVLSNHLDAHEVVLCKDGGTAIHEYETKRFDYVILDICMRDSITGIETLEKLKQIDPEARVILSTGRLPREIDKETLGRLHGVLQKPYDLEKLTALLQVNPVTRTAPEHAVATP